jgi:hypothetical protein
MDVLTYAPSSWSNSSAPAASSAASSVHRNSLKRKQMSSREGVDSSVSCLGAALAVGVACSGTVWSVTSCWVSDVRVRFGWRQATRSYANDLCRIQVASDKQFYSCRRYSECEIGFDQCSRSGATRDQIIADGREYIYTQRCIRVYTKTVLSEDIYS